MTDFDLLSDDVKLKLVTGCINNALRTSGRADLVGQLECGFIKYVGLDGNIETGVALKPLTPVAEQYLKDHTVVTSEKGE